MSTQKADRLATVREVVLPLLRQGAGVDDDTPLVTGGRLDSMAVAELVIQLEDALGVRIPIGQVQPTDFDSIGIIAQTLDRFRATSRGY